MIDLLKVFGLCCWLAKPTILMEKETFQGWFYSYGFLFNYTTVGQAQDSMTALT